MHGRSIFDFLPTGNDADYTCVGVPKFMDRWKESGAASFGP